MDPNQSLEVSQGNENINQVENDDNNKYTLDEPKRESLKREFRSIIQKSKIALFPMTSANTKLLEWDFWGPLFLCLILGLVLSWQKNVVNSGTIFIMIFAIVWIGGLVVSLNSQFLGINLSIFQCICILGYCMLAVVLAAIINLIFFFLPTYIKVIISLLGACYSTYSKFNFLNLFFLLLGAYKFVGHYLQNNKKLLVAYPILLFYLFLAWFTFAN